jgi:hypothetical protein
METQNEPSVSVPLERKTRKSTRLIEINLADFKTHPLWDILTETAQRNPMYAGLVGYTRDHVISKNPKVTPKELASKLSISLGESLVILDEVSKDKESQ